MSKYDIAHRYNFLATNSILYRVYEYRVKLYPNPNQKVFLRMFKAGENWSSMRYIPTGHYSINI